MSEPYIGKETENSPAKGLPTIFVEGKSFAFSPNVVHARLGINGSFSPSSAEEWKEWETTLGHYLSAYDYVSLEMDYAYAENLLESTAAESPKFIPIITISMPYVHQHNYNTVIKISDNGHSKRSWSHRLHDLLVPKHIVKASNMTKKLY